MPRRLHFPHQSPQQHIHESQRDGAKQSREKATYEEPGHHCRRDLENNGINHEPEDAKREYRKGKGDDLQQEPERGVQQSKDKRRDQCCAEARHVETGNDPVNDQETDRHQEPANK